MNVLSGIPQSLRAGDSVSWTRSLPEYPQSDGWSLHYRLVTAGKIIDFAATEGSAYLVALPAATTKDYPAGKYSWVEFVESTAGDRYTLRTGNIQILPDLAAADEGTDQRTQAQRSLDAIDAVLENRSGVDVEEYEISGRRLKKMSIDELMSLRQYFASRVNAENVSAGGPPRRRRVLTGFGGCR